jgi:dephospho-CoA kinase
VDAPQLLGLTGPAGSGKSTILRWLAGRGVVTFDADAAVHDALAGEPEVIAAIRARFGAAVMDGDKVNRSRLAQVVFADAAALADLEAIVHPAVTERVRRWRASSRICAPSARPSGCC